MLTALSLRGPNPPPLLPHPPALTAPTPYLHIEAAVLDAEAPGSGRKAVDDHLGIILVGVVDAQQTRAGGAHTQVAEAQEGRPGEVAQDQHGGVVIRVLLAAAQGPAAPGGFVGGAAVAPCRRGDGARGHDRAGAEQRLRTGRAAPTAARAFKLTAPPITVRAAPSGHAPSLISQSQGGLQPL